MFVSIGASDEEPCDVTVNHQLVSGYINAFKEISEKYDIPNDVSTVSLSRFPDVFTVHKAPEDEDQITADVLSAAKIAVDAFVAMISIASIFAPVPFCRVMMSVHQV